MRHDTSGGIFYKMRRFGSADRKVIQALIELNRTGYGLDLMAQSGLGSGRFYGAINRLEELGYVHHEWELGRVRYHLADAVSH